MIPSSAYIAVGQYLMKKSREHESNENMEPEPEPEPESEYTKVLYDILRDLGADVFIDFLM